MAATHSRPSRLSPSPSGDTRMSNAAPFGSPEDALSEPADDSAFSAADPTGASLPASPGLYRANSVVSHTALPRVHQQVACPAVASTPASTYGQGGIALTSRNQAPSPQGSHADEQNSTLLQQSSKRARPVEGRRAHSASAQPQQSEWCQGPEQHVDGAGSAVFVPARHQSPGARPHSASCPAQGAPDAVSIQSGLLRSGHTATVLQHTCDVSLPHALAPELSVPSQQVSAQPEEIHRVAAAGEAAADPGGLAGRLGRPGTSPSGSANCSAGWARCRHSNGQQGLPAAAGSMTAQQPATAPVITAGASHSLLSFAACSFNGPHAMVGQSAALHHHISTFPTQQPQLSVIQGGDAHAVPIQHTPWRAELHHQEEVAGLLSVGGDVVNGSAATASFARQPSLRVCSNRARPSASRPVGKGMSSHQKLGSGQQQPVDEPAGPQSGSAHRCDASHAVPTCRPVDGPPSTSAQVYQQAVRTIVPAPGTSRSKRRRHETGVASSARGNGALDSPGLVAHMHAASIVEGEGVGPNQGQAPEQRAEQAPGAGQPGCQGPEGMTSLSAILSEAAVDPGPPVSADAFKPPGGCSAYDAGQRDCPHAAASVHATVLLDEDVMSEVDTDLSSMRQDASRQATRACSFAAPQGSVHHGEAEVDEVGSQPAHRRLQGSSRPIASTSGGPLDSCGGRVSAAAHSSATGSGTVDMTSQGAYANGSADAHGARQPTTSTGTSSKGVEKAAAARPPWQSCSAASLGDAATSAAPRRLGIASDGPVIQVPHSPGLQPQPAAAPGLPHHAMPLSAITSAAHSALGSYNSHLPRPGALVAQIAAAASAAAAAASANASTMLPEGSAASADAADQTGPLPTAASGPLRGDNAGESHDRVSQPLPPAGPVLGHFQEQVGLQALSSIAAGQGPGPGRQVAMEQQAHDVQAESVAQPQLDSGERVHGVLPSGAAAQELQSSHTPWLGGPGQPHPAKPAITVVTPAGRLSPQTGAWAMAFGPTHSSDSVPRNAGSNYEPALEDAQGSRRDDTLDSQEGSQHNGSVGVEGERGGENGYQEGDSHHGSASWDQPSVTVATHRPSDSTKAVTSPPMAGARRRDFNKRKRSQSSGAADGPNKPDL